MRPHRLEITAFGPFAGTEVIDFDGLTDAGLFLIQGRTGAGKTSVLDAVCFALFGQVPGARNRIKGLRSDHAPPGAAPRVVLEVTIRGRLFRITRAPEWERPKKRGTGTTHEHASVILEEYERGAWTALSTRLDEAGDLVTRLLGMNAAQFCQVALLPQGEFAVFLRAGADDRRKVLERLFATEVFAKVEEWLAERKRATRRLAEELAAAAGATAGRIAETAGAELPGFETPDELGPWATELTGQLAAGHDQTAVLLDRAAAELETARAAAGAGRALAEHQSRYAEALRRRDRLAARMPERGELVRRLDACTRADRVVPLLREVESRDAQATAALDGALRARAAVAELVSGRPAEDVLIKAARSRRDERARLDGLRGDAVRLQTLTASIAAERDEARRLEAEEAQHAATLEQLPVLVDELRVQLEGLRVRVAGRPGAEAERDEAIRRLDAARRRDLVAGRLAEAEDAQRAAIDGAQLALQSLLDLRRLRLEGMAAVLAEQLVDGEPCGVCGSPEHPAPAGSLGLVPTDADEDAAASAYESAQAGREDAKGKVEGLRVEFDGALETAGEAAVEDLDAAVLAAERDLAGLAEAAELAEQCAANLDQGERALADTREQHADATRALASVRTRTDGLAAQAGQLREKLDEARGDDPSLEARIVRLSRESAALEAAAEAVRLADTASGELAVARATADAAVSAEGFGSAAEVPVLPAADRALLQKALRELEDEEARVRELLAQPPPEGPEPDLAALDTRLAVADDSYNAAYAAADRAGKRGRRLAELTTALHDRVAEWRPAGERHAVAARLADLASGQSPYNRLSMRLSAYVLAARLEQVVAAANERLGRMSAARYTLEHTVDRAATDRRRSGGGLGLHVVDGWTGRRRDPATLSGGEAFLTSLALALGLADVVTAEAGGTEINTLFVDEGFGSLDEDTLDEVMDVLDALRDGGRAVGIVSHVAELRTRIPVQLRVHKARTGSTTSQ